MGLVNANAYLLIDEKSKEAVIIDLGADYKIIKDEIDKYDAKLKYILNTHGHFDHVMGDYEAQKFFNVPVYVHKLDKEMVENLPKQLEKFGFSECPQAPKNISVFDEDDEFYIGDTKIKVIHTPGHTKGSSCFLVNDNLFSGDTLFYTSVGRTDFEGGSFADMTDSIKNKLFTLNDNITVYPGHEGKTTIGYEKKYNCYFGSENPS